MTLDDIANSAVHRRGHHVPGRIRLKLDRPSAATKGLGVGVSFREWQRHGGGPAQHLARSWSWIRPGPDRPRTRGGFFHSDDTDRAADAARELFAAFGLTPQARGIENGKRDVQEGCAPAYVPGMPVPGGVQAGMPRGGQRRMRRPAEAPGASGPVGQAGPAGPVGTPQAGQAMRPNPAPRARRKRKGKTGTWAKTRPRDRNSRRSRPRPRPRKVRKATPPRAPAATPRAITRSRPRPSRPRPGRP